MLPSEVLWQAKTHLENGWCKGKLEDQFGNVCLVGALNKASYGTAMSCRVAPFEAKIQAQLALQQTLGRPNIVTFNNAPDTTQADVLTLVEKAAISLEEQGK